VLVSLSALSSARHLAGEGSPFVAHRLCPSLLFNVGGVRLPGTETHRFELRHQKLLIYRFFIIIIRLLTPLHCRQRWGWPWARCGGDRISSAAGRRTGGGTHRTCKAVATAARTRPTPVLWQRTRSTATAAGVSFRISFQQRPTVIQPGS
jgi:hypothetical protein